MVPMVFFCSDSHIDILHPRSRKDTFLLSVRYLRLPGSFRHSTLVMSSQGRSRQAEAMTSEVMLSSTC